MNNNEAFYTPEGYRYIRQNVLEIPAEALKAAKTEQVALNRATQSMGAVLQQLTLSATTAGWSPAGCAPGRSSMKSPRRWRRPAEARRRPALAATFSRRLMLSETHSSGMRAFFRRRLPCARRHFVWTGKQKM